jgi:hypothetical protein
VGAAVYQWYRAHVLEGANDGGEKAQNQIAAGKIDEVREEVISN